MSSLKLVVGNIADPDLIWGIRVGYDRWETWDYEKVRD